MTRLAAVLFVCVGLACAPQGGERGAALAEPATVETDGDRVTCSTSTSALASHSDAGACRPRPNVMLTVDKSGSMMIPTASGTRLSELKQAMATFLGSSPPVARFGAAFFPDATDAHSCVGACATGRVVVPLVQSDLHGDLQAAADAINSHIQQLGAPGGLPVVGGTPTAATLAALSALPDLKDATRDNFILLLTDGLPNCNTTLDGSTCLCASASCASTNCNCVDLDTVSTIQSLHAQGIRTMVVGFGTDLLDATAEDLLSQMSAAGGMALSCPGGTDAECGVNNACDAATGACSRNFYRAQDAAELAAALPHACDRAAAADTAQP